MGIKKTFVIRSADDSFPIELDTCEHVIVIALEHLWSPNGFHSPVHRYSMLPNECILAWGSWGRR